MASVTAANCLSPYDSDFVLSLHCSHIVSNLDLFEKKLEFLLFLLSDAKYVAWRTSVSIKYINYTAKKEQQSLQNRKFAFHNPI